jgi:predicted nucleotidyltransferase
MIDPQTEKELHALFGSFTDVKLAYLFGSQVSGRTGRMSDYDIAVLLGRGADRRRLRAELAHACAKLLGTARVDIVLLDKAPIELAFAVIATGRRLFEQDVATRVEYEAYVMGRYGDYLPVLREQRRQLLQGEKHDARVQRYRAALERTQRTLGEIAAAASKKPH